MQRPCNLTDLLCGIRASANATFSQRGERKLACSYGDVVVKCFFGCVGDVTDFERVRDGVEKIIRSYSAASFRDVFVLR